MSIFNKLGHSLDIVDGLFATARHGRLHRFTFDPSGGMTGAEVEALLNQYHIPIFGREMPEDDSDHAFKVKEKQADWAEYVLCRAHVPLTCELRKPEHEALRNGAPSRPKAWSKGRRPTGLSAIVAGLSAMAGGPGHGVEERAKEREQRLSRRNRR